MHIYKWTHKSSKKCYIGQSIQDPDQRRLEHISHSRHSPNTYHFHNALRKYGIDAFEWEVIDEANSISELNKLEEMYVKKYDSIDNGYNIRQPGDNRKHTPESIKRMSEAQKKAHARRRENGTDTWTRSDGGAMKGKAHPMKGKTNYKKEAFSKGTLGWKLVDGKRVWFKKEDK